VREAVRREPPARAGHAVGRWRLVDLRGAVPALAGYSLSGLSRLLKRLGIRLKRGRLRVHSPDPAYAAKKARVERALALARAHPGRVGLAYGDEASCHRQPTLADAWSPVGEEPTAELSHRANTRHRVCGALDAVSGRVLRVERGRITVAALKAFLRALRAADPGRYLFLVWDNWPVHKHPEVLVEARAQRIHILWLPTYAPWLNPIEKLWRWLKQEALHRHRLADDWEGLKRAAGAFLDRFAHGSDDLLRYVGLCPH
jgi:transposase